MRMTCTHCRRDLLAADDFCPNCGKAAPGDVSNQPRETQAERLRARDADGLDDSDRGEGSLSEPCRSIARFPHAAEAGFFAHEICDRTGIPVGVRLDERRESVESSWSIWFVIEAPESQAAEAARALQQLIEQSPSDDELAEDQYARPHSAVARSTWADSSGGVNWIPIVLTLTAGSVAFWGIHKARGPNRIAAPDIGQHRALWEILEESPEPWVQPLGNGQGYRALSIDRVRHAVVLREDADGDGRFERESMIRETEVVGR